MTATALDLLLTVAPFPVIYAAADGRLRAFNPAAERVFGYPVAEALEHLVLGDLFDRVADLTRASEASSERTQVTLRAADGERISARISVARADESLLVIVEDLRPLEALERRLSETGRQLVDAERHAISAEVAGATAHHLNQPLTTIMGSVELLTARGDLPRDVYGRLDRIFEDLLLLSRTIQKIAVADRRQKTLYVGGHEVLALQDDDSIEIPRREDPG